jgi:hypothetical protein
MIPPGPEEADQTVRFSDHRRDFRLGARELEARCKCAILITVSFLKTRRRDDGGVLV